MVKGLSRVLAFLAEFFFELAFRNLVKNKPVLGIRTVRLLPFRIKVSGESVPDPFYFNVLLKGHRIAVFRQDSPKTKSTIYRTFKRCVIGNISVGTILYMTQNSIEDFGGFDIGVIVNRPYFYLGSVLTTVIDDLHDVLIELIDNKARSCALRIVFPLCLGFLVPLIQIPEGEGFLGSFPIVTVSLNA